MSVFDRLFGKGRDQAAARKAELRGELALAASLFGAAGHFDEAARVMILRGDAETDPKARLQHYTQAAATAPSGTDWNKKARMKRSELTIAICGDAAVSAVARRDVVEAARDLEAIGELAKAADAFAKAGDKEGEARCLAQAGDVDKLEDLLSGEQFRERSERRREGTQAEIGILVASGRRRDALDALDTLLREQPDDMKIRERAQSIRGRRALGPRATILLRNKRIAMILGDEVVIGRTEGSLQIASNAVSRRHVRIARDKDEVTVSDLESKNGTQLRGIDLAGALPIHEGIDLKLGREVSLRIAPSVDLPGAVDIELAGERYVAPLGRAALSVGGWALIAGPDEWVELDGGGTPAFAAEVALVERATLLVGDQIASERGGETVLKVLGS